MTWCGVGLWLVVTLMAPFEAAAQRADLVVAGVRRAP